MQKALILPRKSSGWRLQSALLDSKFAAFFGPNAA
jgi:hypothetical protein